MKILVTYTSKYGSTKRYAEWLASELGATLRQSKAVTAAELSGYEVVIHGGGLYAGTIRGIKLLRDNAAALRGKRVAVFTVGMGNPDDPVNVENIRTRGAKQLAPEQQVAWFHLRGDMLFSKMSLPHRMMMGMIGKMLAKEPEEKHSEADNAIIHRTDAHFVNRESLAPLVAWARSK